MDAGAVRGDVERVGTQHAPSCVIRVLARFAVANHRAVVPDRHTRAVNQPVVPETLRARGVTTRPATRVTGHAIGACADFGPVAGLALETVVGAGAELTELPAGGAAVAVLPVP